MKFLIFISFILSQSVFADLKNAPPSFISKGQKAVFVDFQKAQYQMTFDAKSGQANVVSTIEFYMPEVGYPLFDSVSQPTLVKINGLKAKQYLRYLPGNKTVMRLLNEELNVGYHSLEIHSPIENGIKFNLERRNWGNVSAGFFIRDLKGRQFLEKYLPSNYEYDQYEMEMEVKVTGTKRWHSLFVNGEKTKITENHYRVKLPNWYRSSSVFFHLVPINKFVRWYLEYPSIDGRMIPVTIYSRYNFYNKYVKSKAWNVLKELENDYGPYPHDQLIIYGTGLKGGMEHAGATETSIVSLGHELQHMYFAKAIHPANGNAGWLDEAIASWRDKGHQTYDKPFYEMVNLGAHSPYRRSTDKRSYEYGRSFMAYLDYLLKDSGKSGLKAFLKVYFEKRKFTAVTTEDFINDLEDYAGMSFGEKFSQYIFGGKELKQHTHDHSHEKDFPENPYHPHTTQEELDSIL